MDESKCNRCNRRCNVFAHVPADGYTTVEVKLLTKDLLFQQYSSGAGGNLLSGKVKKLETQSILYHKTSYVHRLCTRQKLPSAGWFAIIIAEPIIVITLFSALIKSTLQPAVLIGCRRNEFSFRSFFWTHFSSDLSFFSHSLKKIK